MNSNSRISGNLNICAPRKEFSATCLLADVSKDFMVFSMFDSQESRFLFLILQFL